MKFPRFRLDHVPRRLVTMSTALLLVAASANAADNVRLVPDESSGRNVTVVLANSDAPIRGGEIGIAYDSSVVFVTDVELLPGLHPDTLLVFNLDPALARCNLVDGTDRGLSIVWINPVGAGESVLTPTGEHEILRITFAPADGAAIGGTSPLRFMNCLGIPEAPVRNVVTGEDGRSRVARTDDCAFTVDPAPFVRGDANSDGRVNITDGVFVLNFLFAGGSDPLCEDAVDADDSGDIVITDGIFILNFLFSGGPPPAAPYPECGSDPTFDCSTCAVFPPCG